MNTLHLVIGYLPNGDSLCLSACVYKDTAERRAERLRPYLVQYERIEVEQRWLPGRRQRCNICGGGLRCRDYCSRKRGD